MNGSRVRLAYCELAYAGRNNTCGLSIESSDVQVQSCRLHHSGGDGVDIVNQGNTALLQNTEVDQNTRYPIYQSGVDMAPTYRNLSLHDNGIDAVYIAGGAIQRNVKLDGGPGGLNGAPFILAGADVWPGNTLTIRPGTTLRFTAAAAVQVWNAGGLVAEGTATQPIIFTTVQVTPTAGYWNGIRAVIGSRVRLAYCDLGYAGRNNTYALSAESWDVQVHHCRIHHASGDAIRVYNQTQPRLVYNQIDNNSNGLRNANPDTPVDARLNAWGHASGPYHATLNPGGQGNAVSDGVLFSPWLVTYNWMGPQPALFHGTVELNWAALEVAAVSVDVRVSGMSQQIILGTGLSSIGALAWDTRAVPDGVYQLQATFFGESAARGASAEVLGQATRQVGVNNDANLAWHSGRITANETWAAGPVHVVDGTVTVATSVTLALAPGAIVKFLPETGLSVETGAMLNALATATHAIILTSIADDTAGGDTNVYGSLSIPRPGDWGGISRQGTGQVNLTGYVQVRYIKTVHSGALASSETWLGTSVHQVTGNVTVPAGATLTIEPGAVVKLGSDKSILVNAGGTLLAEGELAQPIVFTSVRDDTVGGDTSQDGNQTAPAPGDWYRVWINGGRAAFRHVEMRYGAGTSQTEGALLSTGGSASVTVANSTFHAGLYTGILAWGGQMTVSNTLIYDLDRGASAHPGGTLRLTNCTVGDGRIGLEMHGGTLHAANTLVTNHTESGIWFDFGTIGLLSHNDVWSPAVPGYVRYRGFTDPTGTNGNLSVDPNYRNRANDNYRVNYLSPAIDAADGLAAPPADRMGAPRYDDPRSPNIGVPAANGSYADMGAYEFVETASSDLDLIVTSVAGPAQATAGQVVTLTWTLANLGTTPVMSSQAWHDRIELRPDFVTRGVTELPVAEVLSSGPLAPAGSSQFQAAVRMPGGTEGCWRWQVYANTRGELFEGINWNNNAGPLSTATQLALPELEVGIPLNGQFLAVESPNWYKLQQAAGEEVLVTLDLLSAGESGRTRLYAGYGSMPTEQDFDGRSQQWDSPDSRLTLPAPEQDRTVYLLLMPESLAAERDYRLTASLSTFALESVGVTSAGNAGSTTFPLLGSGFRGGLQARLELAGTILGAAQVQVLTSDAALATIDLAGAPAGLYDLVAAQDGAERRLPHAVTLHPGSGGQLTSGVLLPPAVRVGRVFQGIIRFSSTGDADLPIPLILLEGATTHPVWAEGETQAAAQTLRQVLAIPDSGPLGGTGVLWPGASGTIRFNSRTTVWGWASYQLYAQPGDSAEPVDWSALIAAIGSADSAGLWQQSISDTIRSIQQGYGDGWGHYIAAMVQAADQATGYGLDLPSVPYVLEYMIRRQLTRLSDADLTGQVFLQATGQPVATAWLSLLDENGDTAYTTNSWYDGRSAFPQVEPGTYRLLVDGYLPAPWGEVTVLDRQLEPLQVGVEIGEQLYGQVRRALDGGPVAEGLLTLLSRRAGELRATRSLADGSYAFSGLKAGLFHLWASAPGYRTAVLPSLEVAPNQRNGLSISLVPGATVAGTVRTTGGAAVAGATVVGRLTSEIDSSAARLAVSDDDGAYQLGGLRPGAYEIMAAQAGSGTATRQVVLSASDVAVTVNLTLTQEAQLSGLVSDAETGQPVAGAKVWTEATDLAVPTTTIQTGAYTLVGLAPGATTVVAEADGYLQATAQVTLAAGPNSHDFQLRRPGQISGHLLNPADGNRPIPDVPVTLFVPLGFPLSVGTDQDGEFGFTGLDDGEHAVVVGNGTLAALHPHTYTLSTTLSVYDQITVSLGPAEVTGSVRLSNTRPAAGVQVGLARHGELQLSARTDEAGLYRFLVLQPGVFDVVAWDPAVGIQAVTGIDVTPGPPIHLPELAASPFRITLSVVEAGFRAPVGGAEVTVRRLDCGLPEDAQLVAETGQDGAAVISNLSPGTYQVSARAAGWALTRQTVQVVDADMLSQVALPVQRTVWGQVTGADGYPAAAALVFAADQATGLSYVTLTDEAGQYAISSLPAGSFELWAIDGGGRPARDTVVFGAGHFVKEANLHLAAGGSTLTGVVTTAENHPAAGATVALRTDTGSPVAVAVTDRDGQYQLGPLPAGVFDLRVDALGFAAVTHAVALPAAGQVSHDVVLGGAIALGSYQAPAGQGGSRACLGSFKTDDMSWADWANYIKNSWSKACPKPQPSPLERQLTQKFWDELYEDSLCSTEAEQAAADVKKWKDITSDKYSEWVDAWSNAWKQKAQLLGYGATKAALMYLNMTMLLDSLANAAINTPAWAKIVQGVVPMIQDVVAGPLSGDFDAVGYLLDGLSAMYEKLSPWIGIYQSGMDIIKTAQDLFVGMPQEIFNVLQACIQAQEMYDKTLQRYADAVRRLQDAIAKCRTPTPTVTPSVTPSITPTPTKTPTPTRTPPPPPPPPPDPPPDGGGGTGGGGAIDPNEKLTVGVGPEGFIPPDAPLLFAIRFENVPTATAPAQVVVVTDTLDLHLDWSTLELVGVGFNQLQLAVPAGLQRFHSTAAVATDPNPADVRLALDPETEVLSCVIQSLDRVTGGLPEDPWAGFLPPNDDEGRGEGYLIYQIRPQAGLPDGQRFYNQARIVFDFNPPIDTRVVTNTIDARPPTSTVAALPPLSSQTFAVSWAGDDGEGSGVAYHDVFVSDGPGSPFGPWQVHVTDTAAIFAGVPDHTYGFYSVATDQVGHREATTAAAQATTTVRSNYPVYLPVVMRR